MATIENLYEYANLVESANRKKQTYQRNLKANKNVIEAIEYIKTIPQARTGRRVKNANIGIYKLEKSNEENQKRIDYIDETIKRIKETFPEYAKQYQSTIETNLNSSDKLSFFDNKSIGNNNECIITVTFNNKEEKDYFQELKKQVDTGKILDTTFLNEIRNYINQDSNNENYFFESENYFEFNNERYYSSEINMNFDEEFREKLSELKTKLNQIDEEKKLITQNIEKETNSILEKQGLTIDTINNEQYSNALQQAEEKFFSEIEENKRQYNSVKDELYSLRDKQIEKRYESTQNVDNTIKSLYIEDILNKRELRINELEKEYDNNIENIRVQDLNIKINSKKSDVINEIKKIETNKKIEDTLTHQISNSKSYKNWKKDNTPSHLEEKSEKREPETESIKEYLKEYEKTVSQTPLAQAANKEGLNLAEELQDFYNRDKEEEVYTIGKNSETDIDIEIGNDKINANKTETIEETETEKHVINEAINEQDELENSILEDLGIDNDLDDFDLIEDYNNEIDYNNDNNEISTSVNDKNDEAQTHSLNLDEDEAKEQELEQEPELEPDNKDKEIEIKQDENNINTNKQLANLKEEILEQKREELEKTLAVQLILEAERDEEFKSVQTKRIEELKEWAKEEGIEGIPLTYTIADYHEEIANNVQNAIDDKKIDEKEGLKIIAAEEFKNEIIQKHFPDRQNIVEEAQKINAEITIKAISEMEEFKKFQKENILENGQKPNELDFIRKKVASENLSPETLIRYEEQIAHIEKNFPEMDNSFQHLRKEDVSNEQSEKEKNNVAQDKKLNAKKSLKDKIKDHCDRNSQFTMNSEQLAQQIINDILFPLKALDLSYRNAQKDLENEKKVKINFDGKMYNIIGYENDYKQIKIQSLDGKEKYTVENETKYKAIYDTNALTPYQIEQLKEGRKMIIGQNGQVPLLAQMKQGTITFQTIDKETMDKNILARKGVDIAPDKKESQMQSQMKTQTQTQTVKANKTPAPKKKNILGLK